MPSTRLSCLCGCVFQASRIAWSSSHAAPPLSAPRSCVCGHPVFDDQEPPCPLCACQEHKLRSLTVGDHSAPAVVSPGTGEPLRGPQSELSGPASCKRHAAVRNLCPRTPLASVTPAIRCQRRRPWPSRAHTAPLRARPYPGRGIRRSLGIGPAVAALAPDCRARQHPAHAAAVPRIHGRQPTCLGVSASDVSAI